MITKILIVQTYVVRLEVGGIIATLSSTGMPCLITVPTATSLNGVFLQYLSQILIFLSKGLQNLIYFLGSFGKRYQLFLIWLLSYALPNPFHCSGTIQLNRFNEPHVLHMKGRMGKEGLSPGYLSTTRCNTKAHKKGNTTPGSLFAFSGGWEKKIPIVKVRNHIYITLSHMSSLQSKNSE